MYPIKQAWENRKRGALKGLEIAIQRNEVDEDIIPLLKLINSKNNFFTTSSCSGRICVIEKPLSEIKYKTKFLGKWHREVTFEEVFEACKKHKEEYLWLKQEGPILHIMARTIEDAIELLKEIRDLGFREAGITSVSPSGANVRVVTSEHIAHLLGINGKLLFTEDELKKLVEVANYKLRKAKEKIQKLYNFFLDYD